MNLNDAIHGELYWRRKLTDALALRVRWSKSPRQTTTRGARQWVRHCIQRIRHFRREQGHAELAADRKRHLMRRLDAQRTPDDGPGTVCASCLETRNEYGECPCI